MEFEDKVGQALGWPICYEIMPKQHSVTQWQQAGVLSFPTLPASSREPSNATWTGRAGRLQRQGAAQDLARPLQPLGAVEGILMS